MSQSQLQSCQVCSVPLDADPEGEHGPGHALCWTCWRERNEPALPVPDLGRQTRERILASVGRLEQHVEDFEVRLSIIETAIGFKRRGILHTELDRMLREP